ncbi:MAG: ergothioneine biosynthesis protein EgtB, partial [Myxococcales bacterium]|nr:ergothioneine biosynthesis protein EgtB [Myxococcales bacterium]
MATPRVQDEPSAVADRYHAVRAATEALCRPLEVEDYVVQSMPDASPVKWHLAHTTWFFETFCVRDADPSWKPVDPRYEFLFNSYYNAVGAQFERARRGMLTRPTVEEVYAYRRRVDARVADLLAAGALDDRRLAIVELGLHHEQQHQELLVTDVKHALSMNPLGPVYSARDREISAVPDPIAWRPHPEGLRWIGHEGPDFAFDNETPRHRQFVAPFALASRLVTAGEYRAFMDDGGYERPELWLDAGWALARERRWSAPLYWEARADRRHHFTLAGPREVDPHEPVTHVSLFEADAYARW